MARDEGRGTTVGLHKRSVTSEFLLETAEHDPDRHHFDCRNKNSFASFAFFAAKKTSYIRIQLRTLGCFLLLLLLSFQASLIRFHLRDDDVRIIRHDMPETCSRFGYIILQRFERIVIGQEML